jgi:hypothetical protein
VSLLLLLLLLALFLVAEGFWSGVELPASPVQHN